MTEGLQVLVVDDNLATDSPRDNPFYDRAAFVEDYGDLGFEFLFCSAWDERQSDYSAATVVEYVHQLRSRPSVVLLDIRFGNHEFLGLDILRHTYATFPDLPVVMMTSTAKNDLWEQCVALGALDYLVKPIKPEILKQTLDRYCDTRLHFWLVGQAESFLAAVDQAARAAEGGTSSVLLLGASGTGKELFARYVHRHGDRRDGPFQAVHIPSIPDHLVEAELFGYSKGAFTGAIKDEDGRLCRANGGVLFLDEIADLVPSAQAALLRVLETREVIRLGDGRVKPINVQVVAATNANVAHRVKENTFRFDLYNRLATSVIHLPTLSERPEDMRLLATHLLRRTFQERSMLHLHLAIPEDVMHLLSVQSWPGNLRELWNFMQRVVDLARKEQPSREHFVRSLPGPSEPVVQSVALSSKNKTGGRQILEVLPLSVVKDAPALLEKIVFQELSFLWSALELTRDPVNGSVNRAKAAALLKGQNKSSTNDFDRWVHRLMSRLSQESAKTVRQDYPELEAQSAPQTQS
jgi:two-component system response regulator FlrC